MKKNYEEETRDIAFEVINIIKKGLDPEKNNINFIMDVMTLSNSYYLFTIARSMVPSDVESKADTFQRNVDIVFDIFTKHLKESLDLNKNADVETKH